MVTNSNDIKQLIRSITMPKLPSIVGASILVLMMIMMMFYNMLSATYAKYVKIATWIISILVPIVVIISNMISSSRKNNTKLTDKIYDNAMPIICSISMIPVVVVDLIYDQMILQQDLLNMLIFTLILISVMEYIFTDRKKTGQEINAARYKLKRYSNLAMSTLLVYCCSLEIFHVAKLSRGNSRENGWILSLVYTFAIGLLLFFMKYVVYRILLRSTKDIDYKESTDSESNNDIMGTIQIVDMVNKEDCINRSNRIISSIWIGLIISILTGRAINIYYNSSMFEMIEEE
ncbi:hypothetical protein CWI42_012520 [Ordospora colligata]|nr:hypothetical protein CWI42_012520 [Ordospora colligata]